MPSSKQNTNAAARYPPNQSRAVGLLITAILMTALSVAGLAFGLTRKQPDAVQLVPCAMLVILSGWLWYRWAFQWGTLVFDDWTLELHAPARTVRLEWDAIRSIRLDVPSDTREKQAARRGAMLGGAVGGAVGAAVGHALSTGTAGDSERVHYDGPLRDKMRKLDLRDRGTLPDVVVRGPGRRELLRLRGTHEWDAVMDLVDHAHDLGVHVHTGRSSER